MNEESMRSLGLDERAGKALRHYGYGQTLVLTMKPDEIQRFADVVDEHGKVPDPQASHQAFTAAFNQYHDDRKAAADAPPMPGATPREDT